MLIYLYDKKIIMSTVLIILFVIVTISFLGCSVRDREINYTFDDIENLEDYQIRDIEKMTGYILPEGTSIEAIRLNYYKSEINVIYVYIRLPEDKLNEFVKNFPEIDRFKDFNSPMAWFLLWCGLEKGSIKIEAVFMERYTEIGCSCVLTGDFILILEAEDGYNDIYMQIVYKNENARNTWDMER